MVGEEALPLPGIKLKNVQLKIKIALKILQLQFGVGPPS